tara:strand:- start:64 stop:786 length:723 start_codon:yes stop_codon:yes gene_type:complete
MPIQQMLLGVGAAAGGGGEKSVFFDSDSWLKADDSDLNIGTSSFTIEFWARFNNNAGNNTLNCMLETRSGGGTTSDGIMLARWTHTGTHVNRVSVYMNGFLIEESGTTSLNTWNHWAVVRNGTTLTLYKDGTNVASGTGYDNNWSNDEWFIGTLQNEQSSPTNEMRGYISNFRFTKAAVYTSNFTAPTEPLSSLSDTKLFCCAQDSTSDSVTEVVGDSVSVTTSSGTTGNTPSVDSTSPF